jgi:hypothetical protein
MTEGHRRESESFEQGTNDPLLRSKFKGPLEEPSVLLWKGSRLWSSAGW